jgi:hypothetical protein
MGYFFEYFSGRVSVLQAQTIAVAALIVSAHFRVLPFGLLIIDLTSGSNKNDSALGLNVLMLVWLAKGR